MICSIEDGYFLAELETRSADTHGFISSGLNDFGKKARNRRRRHIDGESRHLCHVR